MKLDSGMHIGMHLVFFGKAGVTTGPSRGALRRRIRAPGTGFVAGGTGPTLQQGGLELGAASNPSIFLSGGWDVGARLRGGGAYSWRW
jgi:hypothetical protein